MKVSISKAADILGVSITTLRRWDAEGKLRAERTPAGHRRYDVAQLNELLMRRDTQRSRHRSTLIYARVAAPEFSEQLTQQIDVLTQYCHERGWAFEVFSDMGAGVNGRLPGLRDVIRTIARGSVERLVMVDADRLTRFGADLILTLCREFRTEVILTHSPIAGLNEAAELAIDIDDILETFEARLNGRLDMIHEDRVEVLRTIAASL